jgi:putative ABC transport system substrate-binding protein
MKVARAAVTVVLALGILVTPLTGETQQTGTKLPRIGYLSGASDSRREEAFRQGLRELGYVDGQSITVEYRFADGKYEKLPGFAAELVRLDVAVIVAATTPAIRAAQRATRTIPIVMTLGEPSEASIASLAHPGGNTTGLSTINTELGGKRLELLKEALPRLSRVAVLYNPTNPISVGQLKSMQAAGRALGAQLQLLAVKSAQDFESAFDAATRARADALMGMPDQLLGGAHRTRLADLALKHRLPTMYWSVGHPQSGSLMSYGPDEPEMHRRAATYVDKILKGARAADLPVEQPAKFAFVINLKTAKTLGLTIPPSLLLRADQVIQ